MGCWIGCWLTEATKRGLKKMLAHHAALWFWWFVHTSYFFFLVHARFSLSLTHNINCYIQLFCAFHSVYWAIKMLCNKFFRCINSIEDFTLCLYIWNIFIVIWHEIFVQRYRPSSQIKNGPLYIDFVRTNGNNLFLQCHEKTFFFGC